MVVPKGEPATASTAKRCRAIRNARRYASIASRAVTITPMLIACAVDLKLSIREAGGVLMTHKPNSTAAGA